MRDCRFQPLRTCGPVLHALYLPYPVTIHCVSHGRADDACSRYADVIVHRLLQATLTKQDVALTGDDVNAIATNSNTRKSAAKKASVRESMRTITSLRMIGREPEPLLVVVSQQGAAAC